ncbi:MAG: hemolysin family protein [Candidatus Micrarchaeota archaeon]
MNDILYGVFIICILLSGFFSASEVAILSMGRIGLKRISEERRLGAGFLKKLKENQRKTLVTILIGNNVVNILASAIAAAIAIDMYGEIGVGIATGIMTFILLILGEIIPKSFASSNHERFALFASPPLYYLGIVFFPVIHFFDFFAGLVSESEKAPFTEKDLRTMVSIGVEEKVLELREQKLIDRVLKFNDIQTKNVMVPIKNFISIDSNLTTDDASKIIIEHEFTRFPVYSGKKDNIIGIIRVKDVLKRFSQDMEGKKLQAIIIPPVRVRDTDLIDDVFKLFQEGHTHMGLVVNSKQKVIGLVTLEDLLEEIVGEFETDSTAKFRGHA